MGSFQLAWKDALWLGRHAFYSVFQRSGKQYAQLGKLFSESQRVTNPNNLLAVTRQALKIWSLHSRKVGWVYFVWAGFPPMIYWIRRRDAIVDIIANWTDRALEEIRIVVTWVLNKLLTSEDEIAIGIYCLIRCRVSLLLLHDLYILPSRKNKYLSSPFMAKWRISTLCTMSATNPSSNRYIGASFMTFHDCKSSSLIRAWYTPLLWLHDWSSIFLSLRHALCKLLHWQKCWYILHACIASSLTLHHASYKLLLSWHCWCILRFCISSSWLRALYKLLHSLLDWCIPHSYKSFAIP